MLRTNYKEEKAEEGVSTRKNQKVFEEDGGDHEDVEGIKEDSRLF